MAVATATALRGQVCSQHRAGTLSRGCWRLVVLLGLAWVALMLLGGTAHAAGDDARSHRAAPTATDAQHVPLLGQVLAGVSDTTDALPLDNVTATTTRTLRALKPAGDEPEAVGAAIDRGTATVAGATHAVAEVTGVADETKQKLPVLGAADAVDAVGEAVEVTASGTASGDQLLDVQLPSATETVVPVVAGLAAQVDATTRTVVDAVEQIAVPVPLARSLTTVLENVAGVVDGATDLAVSATTSVTHAADHLVTATTSVLAPVLHAISGPAGSIAVSGPGAGGGAAGTTPVTDRPALGPVVPGAEPARSSAPIAGTDEIGRSALTGGPAVPPPDASSVSAFVPAQPAAAIVTILQVPVSGAGSTGGTSGPTPTPTLDQTLVRVDESAPEFEVEVTEPIDGPSGSMPGTPAADPTFSPD